jgi:hypothetical protein
MHVAELGERRKQSNDPCDRRPRHSLVVRVQHATSAMTQKRVPTMQQDQLAGCYGPTRLSIVSNNSNIIDQDI